MSYNDINPAAIPEFCPCSNTGCNDQLVEIKMSGSSWEEIGTHVSEMCQDIPEGAIEHRRYGKGTQVKVLVERRRALLLAYDLADRAILLASPGFESGSIALAALRADTRRALKLIGCSVAEGMFEDLQN